MKEETKELVNWIKKQINISKTNHIDKAWNGKHEAYNADYEKAIRFLDSLPEIESHLTLGGYIQDKNGTPCKDGDTIRINGLPPHTTELRFDTNIRAFVVSMPVYGSTEEGKMFLYDNEFEKVEK